MWGARLAPPKVVVWAWRSDWKWGHPWGRFEGSWWAEESALTLVDKWVERMAVLTGKTLDFRWA